MKDRMAQFLGDLRRPGGPNGNAPPAQGAAPFPIPQFAHISEVEHEPQQGESSRLVEEVK